VSGGGHAHPVRGGGEKKGEFQTVSARGTATENAQAKGLGNFFEETGSRKRAKGPRPPGVGENIRSGALRTTSISGSGTYKKKPQRKGATRGEAEKKKGIKRGTGPSSIWNPTKSKEKNAQGGEESGHRKSKE